jgi:hypothetical protein
MPLRILGIRKWLVEDDPFDLAGKLAHLGWINGGLETVQQRRKGLVGRVGLWCKFFVSAASASPHNLRRC